MKNVFGGVGFVKKCRKNAGDKVYFVEQQTKRVWHRTMSHFPNLSLLSLRQEPTDAKRGREEDGDGDGDGNSATANPDPNAVVLKIANFKPPRFEFSDNEFFRSKQRELERLRSDMLGKDGQIDRETMQTGNMQLARNRKKLEYVQQQLASFPERMNLGGDGSGYNANTRAHLFSVKQEELRALFEELALALTLVIQKEEKRDAEKQAMAAASGGSVSKEEMDVEEAIAKINAVQKRTDLRFENELKDEIFNIVDETLNSVSEAVAFSDNPAEATRMKIAFVRSGMQRLNSISIVTYSGLSPKAMETRGLADTRTEFVNLMIELEVLLNKLVDYYVGTASGSSPAPRMARQRSESDAGGMDDRALKQSRS